VETGQLLGNLVDLLRGKASRRQLPVEQVVLSEAGHLHRILDRLAIPGDARRIAGTGDRDHRQIEFGREPAVEPEFLLAIHAASGEGAEIEKSQPDPPS
jgi:hypothetical protein